MVNSSSKVKVFTFNYIWKLMPVGIGRVSAPSFLLFSISLWQVARLERKKRKESKMKPTKNRVFCKDCGRTKMLFETQKKADKFIAFNHQEIETETGYAPQRSYFCLFCGGWHTTSMKEKFGKSTNESLFENYLTEKEKKSISNRTPLDNATEKKSRQLEVETQIKGMNNSQLELFFAERISDIKKEIEKTTKVEQTKLKELRQFLEIMYIVRKQSGMQQTTNSIEKSREKEYEEWRLWIESKGGKTHQE